MSKKAYLIPENPQPDTLLCLRVYIPNDPLYLYAFSGSYEFFAKWLAWERSSDGKATLAARAWRDAIEYTRLNGWLNCGESNVDCCEEIEEIIRRLEELENMNIHVNCGCGCGCGCGSNNPPIPSPPQDELPPYINPNPVPTPEDEAGLAWKCNMSHYLVYSYRYMMVSILSPGSFPDWSELYNGLFSAFIIGGLNFAWAVYTLLLALLNGRPQSEVTDPIDANYDQLVCAIYSASDDQTAYNQFATVLTSIFPQSILRQAAIAMASQLPIYAAFRPGLTSDLPPSYRNRTCENCVSPSDSFPEPPISDGYLYSFACPDTWQESLENEFTLTSGVTNEDNCAYFYTASWPGNGNTWNPRVVVERNTPIGAELVGYAFRIATLTTNGGNDPANGALRVEGQSPDFGGNLLEGAICAYLWTAVAPDFQAWAEQFGVTLFTGNNLELDSTLEIHHYRRSGVTAPAGSLGVVIEPRFIYREPI